MASLQEIQAWLGSNSKLLSRYAGKWVAVSGEGVELSSDSLSSLTRQFKPGQASELLVTRVPTRKEAASLVY
ncbi:MAG: hypothetical protein AABW54_01855 [Candidatus Micrarchaeota archaeon]